MVNFRQRKAYYLVATLCGILMWWPTLGLGAELEVWWEKPPPPIEELTGGRVHMGDKITKDNVELVKEILPDSYYRDTLDGAEWIISPWTPGTEWVLPAMIRATTENRGKVVLKEDGTVLMPDGEPWIGGFPFPEPKTGLEAMVSRQFWGADHVHDLFASYWLNPRKEIYKKTITGCAIFHTTARVCQDPKPVIPGHKAELKREMCMTFDPYDLKGLSVLSVIYVDQGKVPDSWGYVPVLRRIQRFSGGQRYDSFDGSDLRAGDLGAFSDPLGFWDFKLVGRKFILSIIAKDQGGNHPVDEVFPFVNGRYIPGARLSLRDTYIVEAFPRDPSHIYSRKLLYIDAASFWSWHGQFYDRQGELWLGFSLWFKTGAKNDCGPNQEVTYAGIHNYQKGSATVQPMEWYFTNSPEVDESMFTLKYLMAQGR